MNPKVGLLACNSGASNSGTLTGISAIEIIKEFGSELVGICSLPSIVNQIPRQLSLVKKLPYLVVIDGCKNSCAKKIAEKLGLSYNAYLNLEQDLNIKKLGPFTTLHYSDDDVNKVKRAIEEIIKKFLQKGR